MEQEFKVRIASIRHRIKEKKARAVAIGHKFFSDEGAVHGARAIE